MFGGRRGPSQRRVGERVVERNAHPAREAVDAASVQQLLVVDELPVALVAVAVEHARVDSGPDRDGGVELHSQVAIADIARDALAGRVRMAEDADEERFAEQGAPRVQRVGEARVLQAVGRRGDRRPHRVAQPSRRLYLHVGRQNGEPALADAERPAVPAALERRIEVGREQQLVQLVRPPRLEETGRPALVEWKQVLSAVMPGSREQAGRETGPAAAAPDHDAVAHEDSGGDGGHRLDRLRRLLGRWDRCHARSLELGAHLAGREAAGEERCEDALLPGGQPVNGDLGLPHPWHHVVISSSRGALLQNRWPPLMFVGGEDVLALARFPPPLQGRRRPVLHPRRHGDGGQRPDPVSRRPHGRRDSRSQHEPVAARDRGGRRRGPAARLQRRAPDRGRPRVARSRVRPAQPHVRAPPVARARVLRRAADRAADVPRDRGPPVGPLLPRLRAHLPRPIGDHDRDRRGRDVRPRPRARGRSARPHARRGLDRVPLRAAQPPGHTGGAAADRRAHGRGRGEHRRRPRGQGVCAGAAPAAALQQGRGARVRAVDGVHAAARVLLAVHRVPAPARPRRAAARGRAPGDQRHDHRRRVHRLLRLRADADRTDALARDGARHGPARRRERRARLRAARPRPAAHRGARRQAARSGRRSGGAARADLRLRRRRARAARHRPRRRGREDRRPRRPDRLRQDDARDADPPPLRRERGRGGRGRGRRPRPGPGVAARRGGGRVGRRLPLLCAARREHRVRAARRDRGGDQASRRAAHPDPGRLDFERDRHHREPDQVGARRGDGGQDHVRDRAPPLHDRARRRDRRARGRGDRGARHARRAARQLAAVPRDRREGPSRPGLPHPLRPRPRGGGAVNRASRLRHLVSLLRPYRGRVILMFVSLLLATGAALAPPYLAGRAIDDGIHGNDMGALTVIVVLFVAAATINWAATYAQTFLINWVGQRALQDLRVEVFQHLQRLSIGFYSRNKAGVLISRLTNDVQALDQLVTEGISTLFSATLTLVGTAVILVLLDAELAMITFLTFPVLLVASVAFRLASAGAYALTRVKIAQVTAYLQETLSGVRVVRAFGQEGRHRTRFAELNDEHRRVNMRTVYLNAAYFPSVELLSAVATAAILIYGGSQVLDGDSAVTIGVLASFVFYLQSFFDPIQSLSQLYTTYQAGMAALDKIFELLDEKPDLADRADSVELPRVRGEIRFEDVTFSYGGEAPALDHVELVVPPGQTLALVGATGAGKSTLAKLVARFYDPDHGRVKVDGHDLRDVSERSLRSQLGIVPQESFLFSGTIRDNIAFGRPDAGDDEVQTAARAVGAHEFIERLPDGYDTEVG